jgi:hypothetical protein
MKKIFVTLMVMLAFGIASAQVNKMDPPTAITAPGTPPIKNATQELIKQQQTQVSPTSLSPRANTPTVTQPVQRETRENTTLAPYPGATLAYPTAQPALQPGTPVTTEPATGTNNPTTTLPASNTTNQGKMP